MTTSNRIIFITGANKGLGFEAARRLTRLGHTVVLGARDAERGAKAAAELGVRFVPIDVTDDASVAAAAADVQAHEGRVDVLINNAGIASYSGPADLSAAEAASIFDTNAIGIVRVTAAFLPLLRAGEQPAVVNVSSGLGSFEIVHDAERLESTISVPAYAASKAAVTMLTVQYAKGLDDIRFNAVDPGYTATDLNANSGPQTVTEGTDAIVTLATEDASAGSGRFIDRYGSMPW